MSLIRQVWLLLLGTVLLALAGSVAVTVLSSRHTLETQLSLKNSDNAQTLALALSQQHGDPQLMSLLMTAQFDTGYYSQIRFVSADGDVIFDRHAEGAPSKAPRWFSDLVPIESTPGMAQVSDKWHALGAVTVTSHASFAHDDLWRSTIDSAEWLAFVGLAAGLIGTLAVRGIRRPLDATVKQAEALVEGRFMSLPEPRVPELSRLTRAMNTMVSRVKSLFEAQAAQVESLRQQAHHDPLTGLANRRHFMRLLEAALEREDGTVAGGLVLLRLHDLAEVNRLHGHDAADRAILAIAQALQVYPSQVGGCFVGRLNGSDFALCLPVAGVAEESAQAVTEALRVTLPAFGSAVSVAVGSIEIRRDMQAPQMMVAADSALAQAESRGAFGVYHDASALQPSAPQGERAWRSLITAAIAEERARLIEFPVVDRDGAMLHRECPLRLQLDASGLFDAASVWLPHALRGRLTPLVDLCAASLALRAIEVDGLARCVNVAPASLTDSSFASSLREQLLERPRAAQKLWIEVAESAALDHFTLLQALGRQLRPLGVRFGLEHAGERLARIERLYEAGLDYVKLDAAVTRGVATDTQAAEFLRTSATLLHALSLQVIAEGVADEADAKTLWACGVDGMTGPWVGQGTAAS